KQLKIQILCCWLAALALIPLCATAADSVKIGIVNFRTCIETSKIGKQQQENFDSLKKQMETVLSEKDKSLTELSNKLSDPDYIDTLSPEAEAELKHKFRILEQDLAQNQNQYMQTLNQTNFKIVQTLSEIIAKASEKIAKERGLDIVINEEGA